MATYPPASADASKKRIGLDEGSLVPLTERYYQRMAESVAEDERMENQKMKKGQLGVKEIWQSKIRRRKSSAGEVALGQVEIVESRSLFSPVGRPAFLWKRNGELCLVLEEGDRWQLRRKAE
jgi:hypothetical protein